MTQLVDSPTREANILDLVLVSNTDIVDNLIEGDPFSEHSAVTSIPCRDYERRKLNKAIYSYSNADWTYLRELLTYKPWHCAFLEDNIDIIWSAWSDLLFTASDECIPKRQIQTRKYAPWITCELIKLCTKKRKLYKTAKRSGLQKDWKVYRDQDNLKILNLTALAYTTHSCAYPTSENQA